MNKKINFITDLLKSNKIEAAQKERLFVLTSEELKKIGKSDDVIIAEIKQIKSFLQTMVRNKNDMYNNKDYSNVKSKHIMSKEEEDARNEELINLYEQHEQNLIDMYLSQHEQQKAHDEYLADQYEQNQNDLLDKYLAGNDDQESYNQKLANQFEQEELKAMFKTNKKQQSKKQLPGLVQNQDKLLRFSSDSNNEQNSRKKINLKGNLPEYLNPKDLRDFLIEYNQNSVLKYTCHEIDDQDRFQNLLEQCKSNHYEFEKHLKKIHIVYNQLTYTFQKKISANLIVLIATYIGTYDKELTWSENNIAIKWTSPELFQWSTANSGKVPNPSDAFQVEKFRFNTIELNNGNSISNFSELVIYFKNLFHFKNGNTLKSKLEETIFMHFQNEQFNIRFDNEFSERIELFTYSESLMQAFVKIINQKYHKDNFPILDVKLYFNYDADNLKEFKIVILNSKEFGKHFIDFRLGDDFTNLIDKQINGLCDFYIKAYFDDQMSVGMVNIWNGKPMEFIPSNKEIEGVEFILKMY